MIPLPQTWRIHRDLNTKILAQHAPEHAQSQHLRAQSEKHVWKSILAQEPRARDWGQVQMRKEFVKPNWHPASLRVKICGLRKCLTREPQKARIWKEARRSINPSWDPASLRVKMSGFQTFQRTFLAKGLAESVQGRVWRQGLHAAPQKRVWEMLKARGENLGKSEFGPNYLSRTGTPASLRVKIGSFRLVQGLQRRVWRQVFRATPRKRVWERLLEGEPRARASESPNSLARGAQGVSLNVLEDVPGRKASVQARRARGSSKVLKNAPEGKEFRETNANRKVRIGNRRSTELRILFQILATAASKARLERLDNETGQRPQSWESFISAIEQEPEMGGRRELGGRARRARERRIGILIRPKSAETQLGPKRQEAEKGRRLVKHPRRRFLDTLPSRPPFPAKLT
ncbi:hypothetical protein B0H11DRAFT_1924158 [Mycena galericulata]|nr:hypothetical protein B0H11DRAFT_1924158 [Mycena galericulata]